MSTYQVSLSSNPSGSDGVWLDCSRLFEADNRKRAVEMAIRDGLIAEPGPALVHLAVDGPSPPTLFEVVRASTPRLAIEGDEGQGPLRIGKGYLHYRVIPKRGSGFCGGPMVSADSRIDALRRAIERGDIDRPGPVLVALSLDRAIGIYPDPDLFEVIEAPSLIVK